MKLTGIIEEVFRGVTIFRGYSTLKTLAKLSSSTNYQRKHEENRISDIRDYMISSPFVFFPELILGWQIEDNDAIRKIKEEESTSSISIENGIRIKKAKFKFKSLADGEEPKTKVVTIEIPDSLSVSIFNRIDGNHRLVVIDKILEENGEMTNGEISNQIAPFCLIMQNKNTEAEMYEAAYFYLINSKAKPLTSEENLRTIFSGRNFTIGEKKQLLAINGEVIEVIGNCAEYLSINQLQVIDNIFQGNVYTLCYNLCTRLSNKEESNIERSIHYINEIIYTDKKINNPSESFVFALLIMRIDHFEDFERFLNWVCLHNLEHEAGFSYKSYLDLYDRIIKSTIKVFVAMPYFKKEDNKTPDEDLMNDYRSIYDRCFKEIGKQTGKPIEMFPIMDDEGLSQDMIDNIMDEIEHCDIFIADITQSNPNVLYELGRAHGLNKACILVKSDNDVGPCSDIRNLRYYTYKHNSKSTTLLNNIKNNIIAHINSNL